MDKKQVDRSCVTNMQEKDPIINKFMQDYVNSFRQYEGTLKNEELIVNFDITYPDGRQENFTCNGVSNVFGKKNSMHSKQSEEQVKNEECNDTIKLPENYTKFFEEYEKYLYSKEINSSNCFYEKKDKDNKCSDEQVDKKCEDVKGEICILCYLGCTEGIELKGVQFNLYRINGMNPVLVDSKYTDTNGKLSFKNVPMGNYRVIEQIDRKYFSKPVYIKWNEVSIDEDNQNATIYVINKMK